MAVSFCGLKPREFWRLTPREYKYFCDYKEFENKKVARMYAVKLANLLQPHSKRKIDPNRWLPDNWKITAKEQEENKKAQKKKHIPGQATEQLRGFLNKRGRGVPTSSQVDSILGAVIQKGKEQKENG